MIRTVSVALLVAGLLAACGTPPPASTPGETTVTTSSSPAPKHHVLELDVTGTATLSSLVFTLDGKVSELHGLTVGRWPG